MKKEYLMIIFGIILIFADQITKVLFLDVNKDFGIFALRYVENTGISFGLFQGSSLIIIFISVIILGLLYYFKKEFLGKEVFLTLIVSGIIGNLIDRVFLGHVRDFLDLKWWPIFNVADSLMFLGVIGLAVIIVIEHFKSKPLKSENTNNKT